VAVATHSQTAVDAGLRIILEKFMDLYFLGKGLAIGLAIAAPVGPIGVLCIRRGIASGWLAGFASGLGAATADGIYGAMAGFGLTMITNFLVSQQLIIRLVGGLFLCYLGVKTFLSSVSSAVSQEAAKTGEVKNLLGHYLSTFFLTITNPMTILAFVVIFAGLGLGKVHNSLAASLLVLGVFLGSALWWLLLAFMASRLRQRMSSALLRSINWIAGIIITTFGIVALADIIRL
jgi:threonine/homoserine/homoserine lactone efflux protein